jgi:flagellar basal body rod protein FlgG
MSARPAEAIERGAPSETNSINNLGGGVSMNETMTDFSKGAFRTTGNKEDFAIAGEGFFHVDDNGEKFLTRAGNFHISPKGELVTEQGFNVLTESGDPLTITTPDYRLESDGGILQFGELSFLALVRPKSMGDLVKVGQNLFRPLGDVDLIPRGERHVLGNTLELSSVKPAAAMMELVETTRAYEANIKMIQNHDSMTSALVGRLLRA